VELDFLELSCCLVPPMILGEWYLISWMWLIWAWPDWHYCLSKTQHKMLDA